MVSNGLVMECLAKPVAEIAEIRFKGICESVSFCFEYEPLAVIVVEELINCRCAGIGRDDEH